MTSLVSCAMPEDAPCANCAMPHEPTLKLVHAAFSGVFPILERSIRDSSASLGTIALPPCTLALAVPGVCGTGCLTLTSVQVTRSEVCKGVGTCAGFRHKFGEWLLGQAQAAAREWAMVATCMPALSGTTRREELKERLGLMHDCSFRGIVVWSTPETTIRVVGATFSRTLCISKNPCPAAVGVGVEDKDRAKDRAKDRDRVPGAGTPGPVLCTSTTSLCQPQGFKRRRVLDLDL